jgi:hypothetical protein
MVARDQNKVVLVVLERLKPDQFPMGFYMQQCVSLPRWNGDFADPEWCKLLDAGLAGRRHKFAAYRIA